MHFLTKRSWKRQLVFMLFLPMPYGLLSLKNKDSDQKYYYQNNSDEEDYYSHENEDEVQKSLNQSKHEGYV